MPHIGLTCSLAKRSALRCHRSRVCPEQPLGADLAVWGELLVLLRLAGVSHVIGEGGADVNSRHDAHALLSLEVYLM